MAIERGIGSGGVPEELPIAEEAMVFTQDLMELPEEPNVFEMEDGSAIVGEMEEEPIDMMDVPFDANLAEYLDESELGRISSDLIGDVEDEFIISL